MKLNKSFFFSLLVLLAMLALIVILCVRLAPLLVEVAKNADDESVMTNYIAEYGAQGALVLIGLAALQIILAVIPAVAVQVLAGLCYGVWRGILLYLVGLVLGNAAVFLALRQFGKVLGPYLRPRQKKPKSKLLSVQTLRELRHPERIAFFLYLIPGVPNGILPYVFAQTKISFPRYILCVVAGSLPSTLVCTFLGERISHGDYDAAIGIAVAMVVVVLLVVVFRTKILHWVENNGAARSANIE